MAADSYTGAGTTLSSSYYMRNFYTANRDARTAVKRKSMNQASLSLADGMALRRAIRSLGSADFSESKELDIRNRVSAYIDTYNNALSSASGSTDRALTRAGKQMKALTGEYADSLDKIGITVNADGSLTQRDSLFKTADISKFEQLFSKDSDYIQRTASYAKRIERRSEALGLTEKAPHPNNISSQTPVTEASPDSAAGTAPAVSDVAAILELEGVTLPPGKTSATAAAQIVAASIGLPAQTNTGIGNHVNVVL